MSEVDPYAPPQSHVAEPASAGILKAGPGRRFLARAADNILVGLVAVPVFLIATYGVGYAMDEEGALASTCYLIAFAIVFPFQAYFLAVDGQSLAKKLLDLRIVRPDGARVAPLRVIFVREIVGLDADESRALVDALCRPADLPEHQCRLHWEAGSIAFWDNRAVQHYACSDYWPDTRIMERASIVGDRPR